MTRPAPIKSALRTPILFWYYFVALCRAIQSAATHGKIGLRRLKVKRKVVLANECQLPDRVERALQPQIGRNAVPQNKRA